LLILRANPYVDVYNLQIGDKLCIPGGFDNETKPPRPQCPGLNCSPALPCPPFCSGGDSGSGGGNNSEKPEDFMYVVRRPQSIQSVADQFDITVEKLLEANAAEDIIINPGTVLKIPGYPNQIQPRMEEDD